MAKGINSCQCFTRVSRPAASSRLYSGVAGNGVSSPKMGKPRRPGAHLRQSALGHASRVIVHAKNKRRNRVNVAFRQPLQHFAHTRPAC